MAQYKDQITVRVWRNVKTLGKIPTSHFGHAAVTIVKHRQEKPDSQRLRAVLRLGAQILAVLRNPGPIW